MICSRMGKQVYSSVHTLYKARAIFSIPSSLDAHARQNSAGTFRSLQAAFSVLALPDALSISLTVGVVLEVCRPPVLAFAAAPGTAAGGGRFWREKRHSFCSRSEYLPPAVRCIAGAEVDSVVRGGGLRCATGSGGEVSSSLARGD